MAREHTGAPGGQAATPEERRREALPRRPVFTVALAGAEVGRRFRASLRLRFALGVLIGLAPAWLIPLLPMEAGLALQGPLLLAGGALFVLAFAARQRMPRVQQACHMLGLLAFGAALGFGAPRGAAAIPYLMHPTLLVGLPLIGSAAVAGMLRRDLPGWIDFLLAAAWLVPAGIALAWLPAGEWVLAGSGAAGLLLLFLLQIACQEAPPIFTPVESGRAAADALPLSLLGLGRRLTGRA